MSNIIIIGPAYPYRGGIATTNERLARQFQSEGHTVRIVTFSMQYPSFLFPGKTQFSKTPKPTDITIEPIINSVSPLNWIKIGRKIKAEKPDLIVVRYWLPFMGPAFGTILRIAKQNKHTKVLCLVDNIVPHESRPGDRLFTKYFVKPVDGFVTMAQKVYEQIDLFSNKPKSLTPHPLFDNFGPILDRSDARKKLNLPLDSHVYLFFGFIRQYKGVDILIDALNTFKPLEKNAIILIAGEYYAGEDEIKQQIQQSAHKAAIITHTHFISDDEVGIYFSATDVVVQPYRNATQSGVTPLAYHFEVPILITNVGGLPDMVPDGIGVVCEPTPESIADGMDKMLNFDQAKFDATIKKEKKKYEWSIMTKAIMKIAQLDTQNPS